MKEKVKRGRINYWLCVCDCGNEKLARTDHLVNGETTSCGCQTVKRTRLIDRTGQRYGKLTVLRREDNGKNYVCWLCKCDCGNYTIVKAQNLAKGVTKSCGCMQHSHGLRKHGDAHYRSPNLYRVWTTMKQRCENPNRQKYPIYGGRGIKVCDSWQDPNNFIEWALNNGYSDGLQIDRINNNGDYSPENCRWVTAKENCRNRRSNVLLTVDGVTKTVVEWCEESGQNPFTVYDWVKTKGKSYAERRIYERLHS